MQVLTRVPTQVPTRVPTPPRDRPGGPPSRSSKAAANSPLWVVTYPRWLLALTVTLATIGIAVGVVLVAAGGGGGGGSAAVTGAGLVFLVLGWWAVYGAIVVGRYRMTVYADRLDLRRGLRRSSRTLRFSDAVSARLSEAVRRIRFLVVVDRAGRSFHIDIADSPPEMVSHVARSILAAEPDLDPETRTELARRAGSFEVWAASVPGSSVRLSRRRRVRWRRGSVLVLVGVVGMALVGVVMLLMPEPGPRWTGLVALSGCSLLGYPVLRARRADLRAARSHRRDTTSAPDRR